jgi:hypothetical protein
VWFANAGVEEIPMRPSIHSFVALAIIALAPIGAGCTATPDQAEGSVEIPLTQPGPDGALYHLSATLEVTGPSGVPQFVDATGSTATVSLSVPPGITSVLLDSGWTLSKSTDGGASFQPVSALLGSFNPATVRVLANTPVSVEFDFLVRDVNGELTVHFGVDSHPRELAGGIIAATADNDLAPYVATPLAKRVDFAAFFTLATMDSQILADGTKQHVYTAGSNALEIYNDTVGTLTSTIAPQFAAGYLTYHVAAKPDGTQEFGGEYDSNDGSVLTWGPHTIDVPAPLGADGFPQDVFFYDSTSTFTLTTSSLGTPSTMTGTIRIRHLI